MCLQQILRSRRCLLEVAQDSTPAAHGRWNVDGERSPAYCAATLMTASELTPVEGESSDGDVQYDDYLATVLCAELERASGAVYSDFYTVAQKWNNDGERPTADEIAHLEYRVQEVQYSLELLKLSLRGVDK